jgi:hypothetical protein
VREVLDGAGRVAGAERLVGHQREGRLVRRRLQHAVEFRLLAPLGRRLQGAGAPLQAARDEQGFLHGGRMRRGRVRRETAQQGVEGTVVGHGT